MTSKEALDFLNGLISREKHIDSERNKKIIESYNLIKKDLERLESLERENELLKKDLKEYQAHIKKVVYIKDEYGIYPIKILDVELGNHRLYSNSRGIYVSLDLYEYGKTWALTKEELENDN